MTTTPAVSKAIEEIRETFAETAVAFDEDGDGGAWVIVESVPLGEIYAQDETWIGFQITFPYPEADVYPHFVRLDLCRMDGAPLGEGFQPVTWGPRAEPGIQLSRRSNRLDPALDTAATKLLKVLKWLNER